MFAAGLRSYLAVRTFRTSAVGLERAPRRSRTKFVDLTRILVEGGRGGRGVVSFERTYADGT